MSNTAMPTWNLPFEFEPEVYAESHATLRGLEPQALLAHYRRQGRAEGLRANRLAGRGAFAGLVPSDASALEIGPFASPVLGGPNVRYCDVLDTEGLRKRAPEHGMDPRRVPEIHYVMRDGSLEEIPERFDAILGSHSIEHQPDLVAHLQQVERRLAPGGRYLVLAPDHRYCFDRNMAPSTVAEVLQAHHEKRTRHTLKSVIEHRAFMTHNDPALHWQQQAAPVRDGSNVAADKVAAAMREYRLAAGAYIDVHAWYFTPDSFRHLVGLLNDLALTRLKVERVYPTLRNSVEFWAVLTTQPGAPGPLDALAAQTLPPEEPAPDSRPAAGLLARSLRSLVSRR